MRLLPLLLLPLLLAALLRAPALRAGEVRTLDEGECIRLGLAGNPALGVVKGKIAELEGRLNEVTTARKPDVWFEGSYSHTDPPYSFRGGFARAIQQNAWSMILTYEQLLMDFGKTGKYEEAARYNIRSAREEYFTAREDIIYRVRQGYYDILKAEGLVKVARENLETASASLKVANDLVDAGVSPQFDVIRTEVTVAQARQGVVTAEKNLSLARRSLATVMGIDLEAPFEVVMPKNLAPKTLDLEEGKKKALEKRPELRQVALLIDMYKETREAALREKNPSLTFSTYYERDSANAGTPIDYTWNSSLTFNVPIFDKRYARAKEKQALGSLAQMSATYDDVKRRVLLEVSQAYLLHKEALERVELTKKQLESAEEAKSVADVRYEAGVSTVVEVLDAQTALITSRTDYVNSLFDYALSVAQWERATAASRDIDYAGAKTAPAPSGGLPPRRDVEKSER